MDGRRAWPEVPPDLAPVLRGQLRTLADACIAAIREEVPEYHRPMTGDFGRGIRDGVVTALERFIVVVEDHDAGLGPVGDVYRLLGHTEWHAGRSLDSLQAAYRVGARVVWRHAAQAGLAAGIPP